MTPPSEGGERGEGDLTGRRTTFRESFEKWTVDNARSTRRPTRPLYPRLPGGRTLRQALGKWTQKEILRPSTLAQEVLPPPHFLPRPHRPSPVLVSTESVQDTHVRPYTPFPRLH